MLSKASGARFREQNIPPQGPDTRSGFSSLLKPCFGCCRDAGRLLLFPLLLHGAAVAGLKHPTFSLWGVGGCGNTALTVHPPKGVIVSFMVEGKGELLTS